MSDHSPSDQPSPHDNLPQLRARIPNHIGDGVFSTGVIVVTGPSEFVLDFVQNITRPHRVVSRVILPHPVLPQFIDALKKNLELYSNRFGDPPQPPKMPGDGTRPSPQDIYDDLKMADDVLSGAYANGVMIGHGAAEFGLDFITNFFPQSAVSARVYLAAGQVPRLLDSLIGAMKQLQLRGQTPPGANPSLGQQPTPPGSAGPENAGDGNPPGKPPSDSPGNSPGDDPDSWRSPGDDLLPPSQ